MEQPASTRTYPLVDARPRAIAIYCGDPRFQRAYADFLRTELGLGDGDYIPLVNPGAIASLSEPLKLPKEFKFMKERIEFFLENFSSARRVILINHEDCRHYEQMKSLIGRFFLRGVQSMGERQVKDLKAVASMLLNYALPGLQVELYYARFCPGDPQSIQFEKVPL